MREGRNAAARNHPNAIIPFPRKMKGLFLVGAAAGALIVACTPRATPTTFPEPEIPRPTPPLVLPPFQMDSSLAVDRLPPFQTAPLIVWGPPPDGVTHPERVRTYDLQHQVTTIRFDWPRQA